MKHEMGHASYNGSETNSYRNYLQSNGYLSKKGYDGHAPDDPSGKRALLYQNLADLRSPVPKRVRRRGPVKLN